jgi:two-component system, NarL family, nitrate/nitrite response regulator NarL
MEPDINRHIRVVLIDDHDVIRAGLKLLIESRPGLELVGEGGTRADALRLALNVRFDVMLLDLDLGSENGLDFLPQLLTTAPQSRILVLTGIKDPEVHQRAMQLGAAGLVMKDKAADVLLKAIEKVYEGEVWFDRLLMRSLLTEMSRVQATKEADPVELKITKLTEREREIITLVGEGLRNKEIGKRAAISEPTVRNHLTSIFSKLEVSDRFELIIFAYRYGLAKPPC